MDGAQQWPWSDGSVYPVTAASVESGNGVQQGAAKSVTIRRMVWDKLWDSTNQHKASDLIMLITIE